MRKKEYNVKVPRDVAQLGRALRSGRKGRWFESSHPDHPKTLEILAISRVFIFFKIFLFLCD